MLDSLVHLSLQQRWKNQITRLCLPMFETGQDAETWRHKRGHNTRDNRHVRQLRETLRCDAGGNFSEAPTRSSAVYQTQCDAPSKLDIGGANAGCRSMSTSSGSSASACGGEPSSSSDSSAMAHTGEPSSASSDVICLAKSSSRAWSAAASVTASPKSLSLWVRKRRQPVVHAWFLPQTSVPARSAHSAEDCRRHALFMTTSSREPSRTERARVALACAWMQLLKLRKTATSQGCKWAVLCGGDEAQYDVRELRLHGIQGALAGVNAGHVPGCPSLLGFITSSNAAASCRSVVVVAQPFSDECALARAAQARRRLSCPRARSAPACPRRHMLRVTVNVVASRVLPCNWACFTPRGLHPIRCTGKRWQDVSSMFTTLR